MNQASETSRGLYLEDLYVGQRFTSGSYEEMEMLLVSKRSPESLTHSRFTLMQLLHRPASFVAWQ